MPALPSTHNELDGAAQIGRGNGVPRHVAVIMDGNGRWATSRSLPRLAGHKAGVETVRQMVRAFAKRGISALTLFAFSTENWTRPESEIFELMRLLRFFIRSDLAELHASNVRIRIIGERDNLQPDLLAQIGRAHV